MHTSNHRYRSLLLLLILSFCNVSTVAHERGRDYTPQPVIIESYYRIKWGHFEEFLELYNAYHLPVMQEMVKRGHMTSITAEIPRSHGQGEHRWDLRVTQVFPDSKTVDEDGRNAGSIADELFKKSEEDEAAFRAGERRRWELVDSHYDIYIRKQDISSGKIK